jgi:hypothetical protein
MLVEVYECRPFREAAAEYIDASPRTPLMAYAKVCVRGFSRYAAASWSQAADFDIPAERGLSGGPACLRPGRKERQPQPFSRQLKTVYTVLLMCKNPMHGTTPLFRNGVSGHPNG